MKQLIEETPNRLLASLTRDDYALIAKDLKPVELTTGQVLFKPGENVDKVYFPSGGTIASLTLNVKGGAAEAAIIGVEGAIGGIISEGHKPAFAQGIVQVGGAAVSLPISALNRGKRKSPTLRDHFARYADCL